jgi:hypothetical protein
LKLQAGRDSPTTLLLFGSCFFYGRFASIIAAFRAYPVIKYGGAAIGTNRERRNLSLIMSPSLVTPGVADFVFWVWHTD